MNEFPDEVVLQIHHLDDDEEADIVVAAISRASRVAGCRIRRPTDETNSILVYCEADDVGLVGNQLMRAGIGKATDLLLEATAGEIKVIRDLQLDITLVIHINSYGIWLDPGLLSACARHGVGITVSDMAKRMSQIVFTPEV